jgi:4-amino-4-deoxy-L-arabinose transferase-like glycosyltransferase
MNSLPVPDNRGSLRRFSLSTAAMWAIISAVWAIVYIPSLFHPALLDDADTVHAEVSREMLLNHDWVTMFVDGVRYLQKAPLMYWMVTTSYKLFGVSEWQTRLPLALCVLVLAWTVYIFGKRFFGKEAGFFAALVIVTSPGIYVFTRFLIPEVMVAIFLTLGLYFFLIACEQDEPSRWLCWGFAVTVALNVLTKSLIGLVFPLAIMGAFLFLTGDLKRIWKLHLVSSTLVFLIVAVPWHALAAIRNPAQPTGPEKGFLWSYFINEQFLRYLNKRIPHDYDKVPLLLFYTLLLIWILPWFAFVFPAIREIPMSIRPWYDRLSTRARANLLLGIWAVVIVGFFSFSSRQEYYSLPAVPALALLVGGWLQREAESPLGSPERRAGKIVSASLLALGIVIFFSCMAVFAQTHPFPPGTDIGDVLTPHPGVYRLSLGHMQDLTIESFGLFRAPLSEFGVAWLIGTALNWLFRRRGSPVKGNLALTAMMAVVLLCIYQGYVIFSPEISSKNLALAIQKEYQPGQTIVIYRNYENGSSLNFYTGQQVHVVDGLRADLWFGSFFPDAPHVFEDYDSLARLWSGPNRVYFFTQEDLVDKALQSIDPKTVYVFARSGGKVILTNQPSVPVTNSPGLPARTSPQLN